MKVLEGEYKNSYIIKPSGQCYCISYGFFKKKYLNKTTVKSFEVMQEDTSKSATSVLTRGVVGGMLLGPAGMLGGMMSANNKGYILKIVFDDEKVSFIEADKNLYLYLQTMEYQKEPKNNLKTINAVCFKIFRIFFGLFFLFGFLVKMLDKQFLNSFIFLILMLLFIYPKIFNIKRFFKNKK